MDKAKVGEAAAGDAEVHAAPTPLRFPDSTREHSHLRHRFPVTTLSTRARALHGAQTPPLSAGLPGLGTVARPAVSSLIKAPLSDPHPTRVPGFLDADLR